MVAGRRNNSEESRVVSKPDDILYRLSRSPAVFVPPRSAPPVCGPADTGDISMMTGPIFSPRRRRRRRRILTIQFNLTDGAGDLLLVRRQAGWLMPFGSSVACQLIN